MHPPTSKNSSPRDLKKCFLLPLPARPYTSTSPYLTPPLHLGPPPLTSPYSSPPSLFPSPSPTPLAPTAQFTYNQYLRQKFSGGEGNGLRYIFSILVMT